MDFHLCLCSAQHQTFYTIKQNSARGHLPFTQAFVLHLHASHFALIVLQDAYIPKDPATAKQAHRGFGFVTFANADDVDKVLSCAHTISNHEIAVQCAIPKVTWSPLQSLCMKAAHEGTGLPHHMVDAC